MRRTLWEPEHDEFRAGVRQFIEKEVVPHAAEWTEAGIIRRRPDRGGERPVRAARLSVPPGAALSTGCVTDERMPRHRRDA